MQHGFHSWIAPQIRGQHGIYWCASGYGLLALASVVASVIDTGAFEFTVLLLVAGLYAYAALGLLRGLKPAWHVATFLAFLAIMMKSIATACAPGEIADGDRHLYEAALDIVMLALAILAFAYLRKPEIRRLYRVPETYRSDADVRQ